MITPFMDFTRKLAHGQLKNTAAVDQVNTSEIRTAYLEQILDLTNQGLVDITTRMKLLEGVQVLTFVEGQNTYILDEIDYPEYVKLLSVHAKKDKQEVVMTPKTNSHITQPSPTSVRFSSQFMKEYSPAVDIHYQKYHPELQVGDIIDLPANLHEALALYVSGLYLSHMGGEEHSGKGDTYYGLYLKIISEDVGGNISGTSELYDEDTRFRDRGFV